MMGDEDPFSRPSLKEPIHVPGFRMSAASMKNFAMNSSSRYKEQKIGDFHHARLGEYAAYLWMEDSMTDVMVVVQDKEFKAHKAVLACYSPYFKEVLLKPGVNDVHYLEIPCVTAKAFDILLTYMYTGEMKVTCQDLADVYRAARRLGMKDALDRCLEMLTVSATSLENTIYLYVTAKKLDLLEPSLRAFKLMLIHFEPLVATKEFLDLEVDQVTDFFSADEIGTRSEVIVFLAALNWLNYKFLDREPHIVEVMKCVRLPMMTLEEVMVCHHPPLLPGIVCYKEVKQQLLNGTCYVAAKTLGQDHLFTELSCEPRTYLLKGEPSVLWDYDCLYNPRLYPEYRDRKAALKIQAVYRGYITRKKLAEEMRKRTSAAITIQAIIRGFLARKRFEYIKQKAKSIPDRLSWDESRKMYEASSDTFIRVDDLSSVSSSEFSADDAASISSYRSDLTKECANNVIYAIGGYDIGKSSPSSNVVMCYSPSANCWKDIGHIPQPRHDVRIAVLNGHLYCIGGCDPRVNNKSQLTAQKECFKYDLESGEWLPMAPLKNARVFHGVAVLGNILYVVGGKDDKKKMLCSIECYDPLNDKWVETTMMPFPRMGMGVTTYDNMIWIAGGMTVEGKKLILVDNVDCLNTRTLRWIKKPKMPQPTAFMSLVKCRTRLYSIGGAVQSGGKPDLSSITNVYCYDKKGSCWKHSTNLPMPLHSVIASSLGNDIYVLGGYSAQNVAALKEVFYFDSILRRWRPCCHLPSSASGFIFAATGSEIPY